MSKTINTGGPAFPIPLNQGQSWQGMAPCDGMTLRDWFAGKAMQALMGSVDWPSVNPNSDKEAKAALESISMLAFIQADAMLAARDGSAA